MCVLCVGLGTSEGHVYIRSYVCLMALFFLIGDELFLIVIVPLSKVDRVSFRTVVT